MNATVDENNDIRRIEIARAVSHYMVWNNEILKKTT